MQLNRIVILGNAGSGKSSLARKLGQKLSSPIVHLDRLFWGPNWTKPVADEFRNKVIEAISDSRWICEGNYSRRTFDLRLPKADLIIWLNTPRLTCLKRVLIRTFRNEQRPDLPDDCSEKIDLEFLSFLRYIWHFDQKYRPLIEAERQAMGPNVPVIYLNSEVQVFDFIKKITES
ncbi:topology modulation protein [Yersinia massiliensis]|uniref:hypothetical protein n=1 Tax=Yersinia massiliensis TaxID=419257 RepID=UPI0005E9F57A|nr:hypothetical protein [Yersinia massiliensis]CNI61364.1 topology modulation protein [Yersinia massiliensis]